MRRHCCKSKGKKATSTEHELFVMAGWSHITWPSFRSTTLVSMELENWSFALRQVGTVERDRERDRDRDRRGEI